MSNTAVVMNEYDFLKKVVVCKPNFLEIKEIINETQKKFLDQNINLKKAMSQHDSFVDVLESHNINVLNLPPSVDLPEQVFTRDIGFTIGSKIFISNMKENIRKHEIDILKSFLTKNDIDFNFIESGHIEGGDVIVENDKVFIGISGRTSIDAIEELKTKLPNHEIIPVPIHPKYLHLDCLMSILSNKKVLIHKKAFSLEFLDYINKNYSIIEIPENEQETLGTNVLQIGNDTIISLNINKGTNSLLRENGYKVIEVDLTEITKSGGAFRCITMPVKRTELN